MGGAGVGGRGGWRWHGHEAARDGAERSAAEESAVGGERGRVGCFEDEVLLPVDERFFALRVLTPKDKDNMLLRVRDRFDDRISEGFPAEVLV